MELQEGDHEWGDDDNVLNGTRFADTIDGLGGNDLIPMGAQRNGLLERGPDPPNAHPERLHRSNVEDREICVAAKHLLHFPGDNSLSTVDALQRDKLLTLFSDLRSDEGWSAYPSARPALWCREARLTSV